MVSNRLRKFQDKLDPFARLLTRMGFTPNSVTVMALSFSVVASFLLMISGYLMHYLYGTGFFNLAWIFILIAALFILLSGFSDALDGALARHQQGITKFGGFLDSVLDRYADAIIIIGIIFGNHCNIYIGIIALFGSMCVSYSRAKAESAGVPGKYMATGMERMERLLLIFICCIVETIQLLCHALMGTPFLLGVYGWDPALGFAHPFFLGETIGIGIILLAIFTHVTVAHRIYVAYCRLPKTKYSPDEYKKVLEENNSSSEEQKEKSS
ncbi:MAG: CDP-alcohol phosphatidyltransferase family protein [Candidatus Helarchaeales archaeon]